MPTQFGVSANKIDQEDFLKDLLQTALRKEQRSALFVEHPVDSFLSAERRAKMKCLNNLEYKY